MRADDDEQLRELDEIERPGEDDCEVEMVRREREGEAVGESESKKRRGNVVRQVRTGSSITGP